MTADIAVLGAGSWGTALAIQCVRAGRAARLWGRSAAHMAALTREPVNVIMKESTATNNLNTALITASLPE